MTNYFRKFKSPQEIKEAFKNFARKLHPDVSGYDSTRDFQEMLNQYHAALKNFHGFKFTGTDKKSHSYYYSQKRETAMAKVVENLIKASLPERVEIWIVGSWIWVEGVKKDDAVSRKAMKENSLIWHPKRQRFYWKPIGSYSTYTNKSFSAIKSWYGAEKVDRPSSHRNDDEKKSKPIKARQIG